MKLTIIIIAALTSIGCKTTEDTVVGKPPSTAATSTTASDTRDAPPPRPRVPPPRLTIPGWPYMEQGTTFELHWNGGNTAAPLHEGPDPNSRILGDVSWDNGELVLWRDTVMATYRPRVVKASDEWFVEGPVYEDGFLVDQEFTQIEVKKGERVEIWAYAGDLQCFMSKRSKIITGPCPPTELFSGLANGQVRAEWYMPEQKVWWIQITGNNITGWVPVDDRMVVDIVEQ